VKLLFDHHLSRKLVGRLADVFPESSHVAFHHLDQAEDSAIWNFARTHAYTIVTKDSDFNDLSTLRGAPPKIIWLRVGNCTSAVAERVLRSNASRIQHFITQSNDVILELL
jgi:predicted nuclease of predicted toxin-antitoxin system